MQARSDREKFDIAAHLHELAGDPGDAGSTEFVRLSDHAVVRPQSAFMDDSRDAGDFAAAEGLERGAQTAYEPQRKDAVSDDEIAGRKSLLVQAVNFISR